MNTSYFTNITARLNTLTTQINNFTGQSVEAIQLTGSCARLAELGVQTTLQLTGFTAQASDINAQSTEATTDIQTSNDAVIAALAGLQIAPTNLTELITWATAVTATYAGPYAKALANQIVITTQIADIAAASAALAAAIASSTTTITSALTARQNSLGCS